MPLRQAVSAFCRNLAFKRVDTPNPTMRWGWAFWAVAWAVVLSTVDGADVTWANNNDKLVTIEADAFKGLSLGDLLVTQNKALTTIQSGAFSGLTVTQYL